jgi:pyridoxal phosphate enzyme (YggS family)
MNTGIAERVEQVRERLARACAAAGRTEEEVTLVAVSKNHPPEAVEAAAACGLRVFGENRVQEACAKIPHCGGHLEWHLVGHLQSNKIRLALEAFRLIHSIDSPGLLTKLEDHALREGARVRGLVEVNVAGEGSKFGVAPEALEALLEQAAGLRAVSIEGLMCIPPMVADPEDARVYFRRLRELRDRVRGPSGLALPELSMGMSHDFEVAIGEGATLVRVGTDIFGPRPRPVTGEFLD